MKIYCLTLLFLFLAYFSALGQKKAFPIDYFSGFSYSLPLDLKQNDSVKLTAEVKKLATKHSEFYQAALDNYTIADSNLLLRLHIALMYTSLIEEQYQKALQHIDTYRKIRPAPPYSSPFGLFAGPYCKAMLEPGTNSAPGLVNTRLKDNLRQALLALDPAFRDDILSSEKGNYNAASTQLYLREFEKTLEQSIGNTGGKLSDHAGRSLMMQYVDYTFRKKFQPVVEEVLYQVSPARVAEEKVKIPTRDGVKLSALVFRNVSTSRKVPAIVALSPYPSGNEGMKGNIFASNDYVYVYVDSRGRRESEGTFFPFEQDAQDFYDIIEWVSKQPWCDGKVATSGGSYLGFAQWQAVRKGFKHPALKAINPMASVGFGIDFPRLNNMFDTYSLRWATFVTGKELNTALFDDDLFWDEKIYKWYVNQLPFCQLDSVAGIRNAFFQKWISHPDYDAYWKSIMPGKEDYESIDIPILTLTGYYDGDQPGSLYYYNQHLLYGGSKAKANHYLFIGPYNHRGIQWQPGTIQDWNGLQLEKNAQVPVYKYVIWWFDWVLKGKEKPEFLKGPVNYYVTGTGQWKSAASVREISTDTLRFYVTPKPVQHKKRKDLYQLSPQKGKTTGNITYSHDIASLIDSTFLYSYPEMFSDSLYINSPYNLVFETTPLEKDLILSDKIIPKLYMSLNVPDADFMVDIHEITPDGKSLLLTGSGLRMRYRHGADKPKLMQPGKVELVSFNDNTIYIKKLSKGSKLRMTLKINNSPFYEKNYGFGGVVSKESTKNKRIIQAAIHTGEKYPSRIEVPVANLTGEMAGFNYKP